MMILIQTIPRPYPKDRPAAMWRATGICDSADRITNSRNGTSLTISPSISAKPQPSFTVARSGGVCHPIGAASARAIHPEGASTKASPTAIRGGGGTKNGGKEAPPRRRPHPPLQRRTKPHRQQQRQ